MRRPLILVALWYISGVLAGNFLAPPLLFLLASAISLAAAALIWTRARPILIGPAIFLAGWVNIQAHTAVTSPNDVRRIIGVGPELANFRGSLRETPSHRVFVHDQKESWRTICQLDLTEVRLNRHEWQPVVGRVAVMTPGLLTNYFAGQT